MKRDIDLVRRILIETEKADGPLELDRFVTNEWPLSLVGYHVELMIAHNLIDATVTKDWDNTVIRGKIKALTWDGCDYLDAVRNDKIWVKAKNVVKEAAGNTTLDLFKQTAILVTQQAIKSCLGM